MKKLIYIPFLLMVQIVLAQNVEIEGTIKITEGAQAGYILQSDANGVASWTAPNDVDRKQIFVTDFGAKGDGTTDDTNAFNDAIASAAAQGGTVHIPVGNYKITSTISVPGGVQLRGQSLGNSLAVANTSGSRISFHGTNMYALEFSGEFGGCHNLTIMDATGMAAGGLNLSSTNTRFVVGASFHDLFILNFINGTSIKLESLNTTGIAWSSFENIYIRDAKKGIHLEIADDGSFINLVTFRSISIAGTGFESGLLVEGPLSTTDWYSVSMNADCPSVGHIILDTDGSVNMYGLDVRSADASCAAETVLIHLEDNTRGSYLHGAAGKGRIVDLGSNYIDVGSTENISVRPSGNNLFQNAGFKGLSNNTLPFWEFATSSGFTSPANIEMETAHWKDNHNVLKVSVAKGTKARLQPVGYYFTDVFQNKECLFGAMVQSSTDGARVTATFNPCGSGVTSSTAHPNDTNWHFVGKLAEIGTADPCQLDPQFILDNTGGATDAEFYITTPSFVFNRGEKPALEAGPITSAGGIMTGTLSTAMMNVAAPDNNQLQLTADANVYQISGTNTINSINLNTDIFPQGTLITLLFESAGLRVTHDVNSLKLLGATDYAAEEFSTLKLVSLGNGIWQEVDRNCANGCTVVAPKTSDASKDVLEELVLTQASAYHNNTDVVVYPNPAKYGINVSFNNWESEKNYKLQLIDSSGRTLLIKAMDDVTNWVDFNNLNLVPGQYQIQIFDELQSVYSNGLVIVPK